MAIRYERVLVTPELAYKWLRQGHKQLLPDLTGRRLARCERGWTSDDYSDTAGKRREAHRMHKEDIRRAQT